MVVKEVARDMDSSNRLSMGFSWNKASKSPAGVGAGVAVGSGVGVGVGSGVGAGVGSGVGVAVAWGAEDTGVSFSWQPAAPASRPRHSRAAAARRSQ